MGRSADLEEQAKQCEYFMYNMCKIRTKELRDCARPLCCGLCYKNLECEGVCLPLREGTLDVKKDIKY